MRIGILGDIHSNLEALTTVVESMRTARVDHWVQVGDIVGYGPDPRPCLDMVRELGCTVCMGNHDAAVVGLLDTDYFNAYARAAIDWTRSQLRPGDLDYLRGLPLVVEHHAYTVVHGTLHMPEFFGYVLTQVEAEESLRQQRTMVGFVGHSHVPAIYIERPDRQPHDLEVFYESEMRVDLAGAAKVLTNVGSVGQPRDEDPRAAYALYDTDAKQLTIGRVEYDIAACQAKIRAAGLPDVLADRLALGV
jgi:diadenosine tetraphosphatase ApaH/serine/threonine PP2A family protein phosphatase